MTSSPRRREHIWQISRDVSGAVRCNICGFIVEAGAAWEISHIGAPAALGGEEVGVAHVACNRRHGSEIVVPMVAKVKRQRRRHLGISGPGLSSRPMPCGRRSKWKKKMDGSVVRR